MDLLQVSPYDAALPATSHHVQPNPPIDQSPPLPFIIHEIPCEGPGIRETTRRQWEVLKPIIQHIYIEEDKPFSYLANILREEHDFEPT